VRRSAPGEVRLTRRGRLVLTTLFMVLVLGALTVFGSHSTATDEPGAPVQTRTVVVGQGDTLWDIASKTARPGGVREMVYRIEKLNSLPGPALAEGQRLAVPVN
jgi:hypothetical protein